MLKYILLNYILYSMTSETVTNFNNMLFDLASQIAMICPTSIIATNIDIVKRLIKREPKKIIDIFVMYILKYKKQIDSGDDAFFINNKFTSEIGDDNSLLDKVFEFKTLWTQLNQDNRDIVKQYMQYLCQLALAYISQ